MTVEHVAEQLQKSCECFTDIEPARLNVLAEQLVRNISLSTCWTRENCETLLTSTRVERVSIPCITQSCCPPIMRFRPYYQYGINEESLSVSILRQHGIRTERIQLDKSLFSLTTIYGYVEFLVDLQGYAKSCRCASNCEIEVVEFTYDAGFDVLPDCMFPEVCEIVKSIVASELGCGSLEMCCEAKQVDVGYKLTNKRVGELSWSWKKDTESLDYIYRQLIIANRFKSLGMISLCGTDKDDIPTVWALLDDSVTQTYGVRKKKTKPRVCYTEDCRM